MILFQCSSGNIHINILTKQINATENTVLYTQTVSLLSKRIQHTCCQFATFPSSDATQTKTIKSLFEQNYRSVYPRMNIKWRIKRKQRLNKHQCGVSTLYEADGEDIYNLIECSRGPQNYYTIVITYSGMDCERSILSQYSYAFYSTVEQAWAGNYNCLVKWVLYSQSHTGQLLTAIYTIS